MSTLSVFSGIGGLDLGAVACGSNIELRTDIDGSALASCQRGLGTKAVEGDLRTLLAGNLQTAWPSGRNPRLLIGGPPCTAFSHAGFWLEGKRDGSDPAARLVETYLDCIRTFEPEAFVMENVPGLAFKTHRRVLTELLEASRRLGYTCDWRILNAVDYGVPQARRRLFVVGVRGTLDERRPDFSVLPRAPIRRGSGWAIADLADDDSPEPGERPSGRHLQTLLATPPGENYIFFTERGSGESRFRYRGRYWSFLYKLHPDAPSPTIPSTRVTWNGPFHWMSRHLRAREMARLQSLPDWVALADDPALARRHVGNAVPPPLAAVAVWIALCAIDEASPTELPDLVKRSLCPDATYGSVMEALVLPQTAGTSTHSSNSWS